MPKPRIITSYVTPSLWAGLDWEAYRDGYEEFNVVGRGATPEEAVADLMTQEGECHCYGCATMRHKCERE